MRLAGKRLENATSHFFEIKRHVTDYDGVQAVRNSIAIGDADYEAVNIEVFWIWYYIKEAAQVHWDGCTH